MKYIFFGTPEFAAAVLKRLLEADMPPIALVCNPDRPVGRKKIVTAPATKQLIEKQAVIPANAGISVKTFQPEKLDSGFQSMVSSLKPDFAIVAAYAKIIPKSVIQLFPRGVIGVHPSLLPKYRGSSPIQSAILGGEKETGVTLYLLDEKVDHGQILAISKLKSQISNLNYDQLHNQLAELGGELLIKTLPKFIKGGIKPEVQDESRATFTKKFMAQDGFVDEQDLQSALDGTNAGKTAVIDRKVRALNPEPGVWTMRNGKRLKILETEIRNGRLALKKIQEEGGKPYSVAAS